MGDITRLIPDDEADVCIMEEPEHLNWFKPSGANWSEKFTHVVGVVHTNYVYYIRADTSHWASGRVNASIVRAYNKIMARAYCDKVFVLSLPLVSLDLVSVRVFRKHQSYREPKPRKPC